MSKKLGGLGDGEYGEVSLFGLDEFGAPTGVNPLWGGLAGAAVQSGAAVAMRQLTEDPKWFKWSETLGAVAAAVVSAPFIFMEGTRAAGWTGLAAGVVSGGLRQLEYSMSKKGKAIQAALDAGYKVSQAAKAAGQEVDTAEGVHGALGIATIYPAEIPGRLNGAVMVQPLGAPAGYPQFLGTGNLGVPVMYPAEIPGQMNGAGQMSGAGPTLLGAQAQLLGVPISGASSLSSHFGTTAIG